MMMEMFANRFPDIAEKETRCVIMPSGHDLPAGSYYFSESFCNDKQCDCRRAFINIIYENDLIATIGFGWEDTMFYEKWAHDKSMAQDLKGPILEICGIKTRYSDNVLKLFKEVMMKDTIFLDRLKKHYNMFKEELNDTEEDTDMDELEDFNPNEHTVIDLCKERGTGLDVINDNNREAFYPIIMAIEETIWTYYLKDKSLKDSEVIEFLKNIRDNIFSETGRFNELEDNIINKIKLVLFLNSYDKRDLSLSISSVLKSAKLHRSTGGNRGYLTFISHFFNQMKESDDTKLQT